MHGTNERFSDRDTRTPHWAGSLVTLVAEPPTVPLYVVCVCVCSELVLG